VSPPLKPGDVVEIRVEKGVYGGVGLARHEGQVVFVPRGFPGDRLKVEVVGLRKGYARAAIRERLEDGPGRRAPPCPYTAPCGGCSYQELEPEASRSLKEAILRESLERSGVPFGGPIALRPSPEVGWRSRASLHFGGNEQALTLGLHEEGTRRVVDIEACLQLSPAMNQAARAALRAVSERPGLRGRVSDLEIAESPDRLVLALRADMEAGEAPRHASIAREIPATGVGISCRRGVFVSLSGEPFLKWDIHGVRLRSHVLSFFQGNRFLVPDLVETVLAFLPAGERILDLYAGVGLFAIPAGARGDAVRGAEQNPFAVEDARKNAQAAGLHNVRFEKGDVLGLLRGWPPVKEEAVVLDPPRTGAGVEVVRAIVAREPRAVVYVSCDPPTLGRDLKAFAEGGYGLQELRGFDLFPDTSHLEVVALLLRGGTPGTLC
jgi:23S rRNA (uracil1939-C5)-methyltransferase